MSVFSRTAAMALCISAASLAVHAQRGAGDWTQYRGAARDGNAPGFTAPATWPEALVQKWKIEVGTGYASPIVVGDRVYVFSRRGDNEGMSAHDAATGKELWRFGYSAPFTMHSAATRHNQGPKSTPIYTNGRLLSIGMTGVVTAWDAATGKQLWQKPASDVVPLYTTHAFSPIVDGNTVIFHVGGHDRGALTAFDIGTGNAALELAGRRPGIRLADHRRPSAVRGRSSRSRSPRSSASTSQAGRCSGSVPFPSQVSTNSNTPILHGQTIIVSGNGGPTVAFTAAKNGATWTTTNVWENADIPLRLTNMVLMGDMLFGMTNRNAGQYFAVDAKSGKTLWISPGRQASNSAIARAGDYLLSLEDDGELVVVKNSQSAFEIVKKYKVADGETWAEAVFSGNRIYVKDLNHLTLWTLS